MKKYLWISLIYFLPLCVQAANTQEFSVFMGRNMQKGITVKRQNINKKVVYSLAYEPEGLSGGFIKAIPKEIFEEIYTQGKVWQKSLSSKRSIASVKVCTRLLRISVDNQLRPACMDAMSVKDRKKFISWYKQQTRLAMPVRPI